MLWTVEIPHNVAKRLSKLPDKIIDRLEILIAEIEVEGPARGNWLNYGKLEGTKNKHHCHIKAGKPTYVAVWEVIDKSIHLVEVIYVGTHEKAPY